MGLIIKKLKLPLLREFWRKTQMKIRMRNNSKQTTTKILALRDSSNNK